MNLIKNHKLISIFNSYPLSNWINFVGINLPKTKGEMKETLKGIVNLPLAYCTLPDGQMGISAFSDNLLISGCSTIANYRNNKNPEFYINVVIFVACKNKEGSWSVVLDSPDMQQSVAKFYPYPPKKFPINKMSDLKNSELKVVSAKIRTIITKAAKSKNPIKFLNSMFG